MPSLSIRRHQVWLPPLGRPLPAHSGPGDAPHPANHGPVMAGQCFIATVRGPCAVYVGLHPAHRLASNAPPVSLDQPLRGVGCRVSLKPGLQASTRVVVHHGDQVAVALKQETSLAHIRWSFAAATSTVGDTFDLPQDLQRWLAVVPQGRRTAAAKGDRFPVRIEANAGGDSSN